MYAWQENRFRLSEFNSLLLVFMNPTLQSVFCHLFVAGLQTTLIVVCVLLQETAILTALLGAVMTQDGTVGQTKAARIKKLN